MPVFNYVSVDEQGNTRKGVLDGNSEQEVQTNLQKMNLIPLEITQAEGGKSSGKKWRLFGEKKVSSNTLAMMTLQLGTLLTAGLTVEASLLNIAEQMDKTNLKSILLNVRLRVLEGHTLAYGMGEYPEVFPSLYRATIAAGEKTGQLDSIINRLANYLEQQNLIKGKITQALIYPALLMFVSFAIITFLITYAMPKITNVFIESGQALPTSTAILLGASDILRAYGIYIVLFIIAAIIIFRRKLKDDSFRCKVQLLLLKIPVLNSTIKIINAARFSRTFGILFAAGVPVLESMHTANTTVNLLPMRQAIDKATGYVVEGVSVSQALAETGYFSKVSTQLLASGESSGKLDIMLEKTAMYQEKQVEKWITTTLALFEPIMILFMGVMVLFIVLAMLLPIFQMNDFFG